MNTGNEVAVRSVGGHHENTNTPTSAAGRFKRMMFIASLYFRLRGVKDPSRAELDEVNAMFHLVQDNRALRFPAATSNLIWGSLDISELYSRYQSGATSMAALAMEVSSQVPRWMKYGDGRTLRQDVQIVFECVRKL